MDPRRVCVSRVTDLAYVFTGRDGPGARTVAAVDSVNTIERNQYVSLAVVAAYANTKDFDALVKRAGGLVYANTETYESAVKNVEATAYANMEYDGEAVRSAMGAATANTENNAIVVKSAEALVSANTIVKNGTARHVMDRGCVLFAKTSLLWSGSTAPLVILIIFLLHAVYLAPAVLG